MSKSTNKEPDRKRRPGLTANEALQKGFQFSLGRGVRKSKRKARAFYVQAAEAGDPDGLYFASDMLAHGEGGPFDRATAFRYVERAADLGNLDAIYTLGYYYMTGGMGNIGYPDEVLAQKRVRKDEARGLALWESAAAQGHGMAAFRIGEYYEYFMPGDPNMLGRAIKWYQRSAELGDPMALVFLGDFYILGRGVEKDRKRARAMYQRAARSDDYCAQEAGKRRLKDFKELETTLHGR
jgi:TPR repeat protein